MTFCEGNGVDYVLGLARNARLVRAIGGELHEAKQQFEQTGAAARRFTEFFYRAKKTWSRSRRVVAKAEHLQKGSNPRFVVTSLSRETMEGRPVYEEFYCARGAMENRIKEQQLGLFADRTSTAYLRSNQLRLYLSSFAYCLMQALRRLGLSGTEMAKAQCTTIRLKLLKVGAQIRITVRKVWLHLSAGHPAARVRVGAAFETGEGVPRDLETAAAWFRKAADQGNGEACLRLGAPYAVGRGVPRNPAEALRWYRRAADLGIPEARFALGALHEYGTGVRRDEAEALRWYRLAASAGHPQARGEASRLEGTRGEPRLFGISLSRATRREIRAALGSLGVRPVREDDRYWYDTYDSSGLFPGSGELVAGYGGRLERLAVLRCTFPVTMSAPSVEELAEAIEEKYGPADFERGSPARGPAEYRWNIGEATVTLQRSRTDGPRAPHL